MKFDELKNGVIPTFERNGNDISFETEGDEEQKLILMVLVLHQWMMFLS